MTPPLKPLLLAEICAAVDAALNNGLEVTGIRISFDEWHRLCRETSAFSYSPQESQHRKILGRPIILCYDKSFTVLTQEAVPPNMVEV